MKKERRKYNRFRCKNAIKCNINYYEGDPDLMDDITKMHPLKTRGAVIDISRGGVLLVSNLNAAISMPIHLAFMIAEQKCERFGTIVRTGLLKDNPSEIAQKISAVFKAIGLYYIAVEFDDIIPSFSERDL